MRVSVAHSLILGMTESGKTTCAKRMALYLHARGFGIVILDPMSDPGWRPQSKTNGKELVAGFFQTSNPDEFLDVVWKSRACHCFIDEAGENVGQYDTAMIRTATKGRHWGHSMYYLSQRGTLIARTVRDQCSHLFLFNTALEDCKIHANEWNQPELKLAGPQLAKGNFFHATRFGQLQRGSLFGNTQGELNDRLSDNRSRGSRDGDRSLGAQDGTGKTGSEIAALPPANTSTESENS